MTPLAELAASIAHEVNQPLAAIVTNEEANLRWLTHSPPELDQVRSGLRRTIRDAKRASDVINRIPALSKKTELERVRLDLNDVIDEAIKLAHHGVVSHRLSLRLELAAELPPVLGGRI
jgi:two-component system sensor kinase FixL